MSSFTKWIPFQLAARLRCLQQGSLNVGNTQQNLVNLLALITANANGGGSGGNYNTLLHFDDGNGSTAFTDSGSSPSTWTATNTSGSTAESTTQAQFGTGSLLVNGAKTWIATPQNSGGPLDITATDFTVECWVFPTSTTQTNASANGDCVIIDLSAGGNTLFELHMLATLRVAPQGNGQNNWSGLGGTTAPMTLNAWNHVAFVRHGLSTLLGLNGTLVASATLTGNGNATAITNGNKAFIGANFLSGVQSTSFSGGFIDEVAISTTAKYTGSSYTVPTAPLSNGSPQGTYGKWSAAVNEGKKLLVYPALVPGFVKPIAS